MSLLCDVRWDVRKVAAAARNLLCNAIGERSKDWVVAGSLNLPSSGGRHGQAGSPSDSTESHRMRTHRAICRETLLDLGESIKAKGTPSSSPHARLLRLPLLDIERRLGPDPAALGGGKKKKKARPGEAPSVFSARFSPRNGPLPTPASSTLHPSIDWASRRLL